MKILNKQKIVNDPVHGFMNIPHEILFDLIEHPYFQRLRRIKQLGLTHLVYPGALHTRFNHALGAMHLTTKALEILRFKGHEITDEETKALLIAILLHDIGHGPFSHSLENVIVYEMNHEQLSHLFMHALNKEFDGQLSLALAIFNNTYHKKFLHQLVSSHLDMDRMDYLKRDCFYTGVSEGIISSDRIIDMLDVVNDELVVESKGIYSVENFIVARRLMYWQVYLHKTVIAAEKLLINILKRASTLAQSNVDLFGTPSFKHFLYNKFTESDFNATPKLLDVFADLDDHDVVSSIKVWTQHPDKILSELYKCLINRKLYKIILSDAPFSEDFLQNYKIKVIAKHNLQEEEINYYLTTGSIKNNAYSSDLGKINILMKDNSIIDIAQAAEHLNVNALSGDIVKHYICYLP